MLSQGDQEPELRRYLRVLRRRAGIIVLVAVLVVGGAVAASLLQTPKYTATAEVLLQTQTTPTLFNFGAAQDQTPTAVATEIEVVTSAPVQAAVQRQLGSAPPVSVVPAGQTDVIDVSAGSTSPSQAAAIANAYSNAYIAFRRNQAIASLLAAASQVQARINGINQQIASLDAKVASAPTASQGTIQASQASQRDALSTQLSAFRSQLDELQLNSSLATAGAQLITPATTPSSPSSPKPLHEGLVALGIGLVLGLCLAFALEYLDDSIKSKEDLDRLAPGLPVLALVPTVTAWKDTDKPLVVSLTDHSSAATESYRTLRTSVQFMSMDRPMRTIQVTSPVAVEGKTTTLTNLAVALAQAGQRVTLVCCDLRRPRVHEFFGLTNGLGFTSVLLGDVPLSTALQDVPGVDRLQLLASGPIPPNPSELLASRRTIEVLAALQAEADMVLIDSPPVLPVTDAAVLSGRVDATLLVASARITTRKELSRAVEILDQVDAPLVGIVLNGVPDQGSYGYAYGYGYASKPQPDQPQPRKPGPQEPEAKRTGWRRPEIARR